MFEWALGIANTTPFVMIDSNGDELSGLTIAVKVLKPGQTSASNGAGTVTEIVGMTGWYLYTCTAAEANTAGNAALQISATGAIQQNIPIKVGSIGVWTNATRTLTQSVATVYAAMVADELTLYRGTTWSITFTGIDTDNLDNVWFTIKEKATDVDNQALVQIDNNTGLLVINKTEGTAGNGSVTIGSGTVTVTLQPSESSKLGLFDNIHYDLKGLYSTSGVVLISDGYRKANIKPDITRSYS